MAFSMDAQRAHGIGVLILFLDFCVASGSPGGRRPEGLADGERGFGPKI